MSATGRTGATGATGATGRTGAMGAMFARSSSRISASSRVSSSITGLRGAIVLQDQAEDDPDDEAREQRKANRVCVIECLNLHIENPYLSQEFADDALMNSQRNYSCGGADLDRGNNVS